MTDKTSILITDASIFFDLELTNCWNAFFYLPYSRITTFYIWDELDDTIQSKLKPRIKSNLLELTEPDEDFTENRLKLQKWNRLSLPDRSIFSLCMETDGILLTSDGVLRELAKTASLNTHGLLWLFDQMVNHQCIHTKIAKDKLEMLFEMNAMYRNNQALKQAFNRLKKNWDKL